MRKKLKALDKERFRVTAEFGKFGVKRNWNGYEEPTVCFQNIKDSDNNLLTDHIWFTVGKRINDLNLQEGDIIQFEARVSGYKKGYYKNDFDYKLNNPTKFKLLNREVSEVIVEEELSPEENRINRVKEIFSYFSCKSVYDLNFLIGKDSVVKLKNKKIPIESVQILNLTKPKPYIVHEPILIPEHYLNIKYTFNIEKQCYQKKIKV